MGAKIEAIEFIFPSKCVTNQDLGESHPDYDFLRFEKKIGVKQRYVVENETALDLAEWACNKLFDRVDKSEIDYLLYCTQSPEYLLPTTACILQNRLGLRTDIGALDFNLGCSGFTYGVSLAKALIQSNQAKKVLLVTAETYSKHLNYEDRSNKAIFGDAAAGTMISYAENDQIGNFLSGTDGSGYDKLIIKNGGAKNAVNVDSEHKQYGSGNLYTDNDIFMDGPAIFNFTSSVIPAFNRKVLAANNIEKEAVDLFLFHQANSFMLESLRKIIGVNPENFYNDLSDGGNTVSCTIPIALKRYSESLDSDELKKVIILGFGVGLSWSGGLINIDNKL
ncbi:ketoacyl-ACP synthase III [Mucilaginibacter sp. dw_454]|uniref:ketoacyl-ACP synthase III n=1 Tax=Mucilaginibacter sp. dw_454 TaxID=2720079 RepID=UPI001BD27C1A|nr:ketoacyl-ACP synthase III [Mucilaginibacter sp. dw_454]